uniref:NADH dehydrogenase subunit 3 n=1 Tax=Exostira schroederi TaxID=2969970 RepID=UPI002176C578|nr:NADH dehydrogenase subunit 3 [Exostira schroederi]UUL71671.1 NADH dehydrogenase subunit 3 [Exostira schroederi]
MKIIVLISFIILTILLILITVLNFTSKKMYSDREKSSPFECGFDPKASTRLPFSSHFFFIAMIFLIFDVEITLILPFIMTFKIMVIQPYWIALTTFIFILLIGLFHEWNQGALNWKI